ncbi:MAG: hypothetical protein IT355_16265 [Gemmatimonadaceae bacterium]|nr:hypothetical protein [Gemmatimonadaceae bacterium]
MPAPHAPIEVREYPAPVLGRNEAVLRTLLWERSSLSISSLRASQEIVPLLHFSAFSALSA